MAIPPRQVRWRMVALGALVGLQALILGFLLWLFSEPAFQNRAPLEARPLLKQAAPVVTRERIVDAVHMFSGDDDEGLAERPDGDLRKRLVPDSGHFSWVVIDETVAADAPIDRLGTDSMRGAKAEIKRWKASLRDGLLNFFYDVGGRQDVFTHNWSDVGAHELQMSPLLSWTKGIDFVVLSGYEKDRVAGLPYVARNATLPVFVPQGNPGPVLKDLRRIIAVPKGVTRLSERLSLFAYGEPLHLALVIEGRRGPVLVTASHEVPPQRIIPQAEKALGKKLAMFVGPTGYRFGVEDAALERELRALKASRPHLVMVPSADTSPAAHGLLQEIFGDAHYQAGMLGARVSF